jgi:hypothetical protein
MALPLIQNSPRRKPLNSGDDIDRNFAREERTALFINLAGVHAQQALSVVDEGIASRKLEKILANVLIDWHWLSFNHPTEFKFYGTGELRWAPVRDGATALVVPSIDYAGIKLHQGYFANLFDLFDASREYKKYGFKGVIGKRQLLFPAFIPLATLTKSPVESQERHYWEQLVKVYAALDVSALNALASCRNDATSVLCLWTQFILWKRYMGMAVDALRQEAVESLDNRKRQELVEKFKDARECVRQLSFLVGYKSKIQKYIKQVEEVAKNTELSAYIPVTDTLPQTPLADKRETFVELSALLKDLNGICRNFQIHMELAQPSETISYAALQAALRNIQTRLAISGEIVDFTKWQSLFLQGDAKREAARLLLLLIEAVFAAFERKLELRFDRLSVHYQTVLERFYPLPTEHFLGGN